MNSASAHPFRRTATWCVLAVHLAPAVAAQWVERPVYPAAAEAAAYDPLRARVVAYEPLPSFRTWEFDGARWLLRPSAAAPRLVWARAAFDPSRGRTLLVGLNVAQSLETWSWDGADWTLEQPIFRPPSRWRFGLASDSARNRIVLFGGLEAVALRLLDDTWEWDGSDWQQRAPAVRPSPRDAVAMTDTGGGVLLYGGAAPGVVHDTWAWDGTSWRQLQPATTPMLHVLAMGSHPSTVAPVLAGVANGGLEAWTWTGVDWRQIAPPPFGFVSVSDGGPGRILAIGAGATAAWDGTGWTVVDGQPLAGPAAFDLGRGRLVLDNGPYTFEWDGGRWRAFAYSGPQLVARAMAYDSVNGGALLYGIDRFSGQHTLLWNGSTWTAASVSGPARPPFPSAMVDDEARRRIVLFVSGETWEWDGSSWQRRQPPTSPAVRSGHAMAYDSARRRVVLFGGAAGGTLLGDHWEWDGATWRQLSAARMPAARTGHSMTYDTGRQVVVLFGGRDANERILDDVWHWDGTQWYRRPAAPVSREGGVLVHDRVRQRSVFVGGIDPLYPPPGSVRDTWLVDAPVVAAVASRGAGCGGSSGVPSLAASAPRLATAGVVDVVGGRRNAPSAVLFASQAASLWLGSGCSLELVPGSVLFAQPLTTNASGFASVPWTIPGNAVLAGVRLHAQAVVVDPSGPLGGLTFTAGLTLTLGD